jgi:hypothetical protein
VASLSGSKVVVGDGPARAGLARRFLDAVFLGTKRGEALAAVYAAADVFVFPSKTDTFGLVLLEALASGVPVCGISSQRTARRDPAGAAQAVGKVPTFGIRWPPILRREWRGGSVVKISERQERPIPQQAAPRSSRLPHPASLAIPEPFAMPPCGPRCHTRLYKPLHTF